MRENPVANLGPAVQFLLPAQTTMTKVPKLIRLIVLLGGAAGFLAAASAQTAEQIIAKARAYLGDEAALNAVQSIHLRGTVESSQTTAQGPKQQKFGVEILFQKPYQQRIVTTAPDLIDTTALNDYDGWHRRQTGGTPGRDQLDLLNPAQIKRLRANTWENLNFFKGIQQRGGRAEVIGPAPVGDQPALKVAFTHDTGIVFYRYFDPQTGRLLLTETDQGEHIREEGEIMVNGVRFAQKVIQTSKGRDAKGQPVEQTMIITYDKITCNEPFTDSDFELPILSLSRRKAAPAPAH
jgi:outer membrane lipoprotein-sorting protein